MSRCCSVVKDKSVMSGHTVSHSNRKAKRKFLPNLQNISFLSDILKQKIHLRVATNTIRTIEHNDGIDNYLLTTSSSKLSLTAKKFKNKILEAIASNKQEASQ
jgi:large subunit ribosomal protein L28